MYLFFDTETSGLPRNWKAPVTRLKNCPRIVQLAWLEHDKEGKLISEGNYIIKPNDFKISAKAIEIHGITMEKAEEEGVELIPVLKEFAEIVERCKCLVAHNIDFDEKIVGAEFLRNDMTNSMKATRSLCTMKMTTDFCAIPGKYGYKWPTLSELYFRLFREELVDAHDAMVDIKATTKCFWELKRRMLI